MFGISNRKNGRTDWWTIDGVSLTVGSHIDWHQFQSDDKIVADGTDSGESGYGICVGGGDWLKGFEILFTGPTKI